MRDSNGNNDKLARYREKREADNTTEPFGSAPGEGSAKGGIFVIHQHDATRLHWDLRLEIDGVLVCWAIPKVPTLDPQIKRLAVHVEPHPVEYADFEGIIPKGNYGAGPTIIWDRGRWIADGDMSNWQKQGELKFELFGYKLAGRFTLVHTARDSPKHWLLIKKNDATATANKTLSEQSVVSGATIVDWKNDFARFKSLVSTVAASDLPKHKLKLDAIKPALCTTSVEPFDDPDYLFEIKYDGYRLISQKRGEKVRLRYRSGQDATRRFPEIVRVLQHIPVDSFTLDGELVAFDFDGKPSFNLLQQRTQWQHEREILAAARHFPVSYMVFDVLTLDKYDLRKQPLITRKHFLRELVPDAGAVRFVDHVEKVGSAFFHSADKLELEGIVGKPKDSPYPDGRSKKWRRIVTGRTGVFWICGLTEPEGSRVGLGGLHLALKQDDEWIYRGRVGSGFTSEELIRLRDKLDVLPDWKPPFVAPVKNGRWCEPRYLCEVSYRMLSPEGNLRFPVWGGLVKGEESVDERPSSPPPVPDVVVAPVDKRVRVTNRDKVFWPQEGYTKGDLVDYYEAAWPYLAPYLKDRPVVMTRFPDGIDGKSFFQKNAPQWKPSWIRVERMWSKRSERHIDYFICDDVESLAYLANLGMIPLHMWASRFSALNQPDWMSIDLDPKGAPFTHVVAIAQHIKQICDTAGIETWVKTSGSSGIHILTPMGRGYTHVQARHLAHLICGIVQTDMPDITTTARSLDQRDGKVYLDWGQNGHGRLLVGPFSVREKPGAPVSMPLSWEDITPKLTADAYTIKNAFARLEAFGDPMAEVLEKRLDLAAALEGLMPFVPDKPGED